MIVFPKSQIKKCDRSVSKAQIRTLCFLPSYFHQGKKPFQIEIKLKTTRCKDSLLEAILRTFW